MWYKYAGQVIISGVRHEKELLEGADVKHLGEHYALLEEFYVLVFNKSKQNVM